MTTISIVTGGSRGLGRNTRLSIARHGGDVILTYRSGNADAKAVVAEIEGMGRKALALQLDVSDTSTFPAFVKSVCSALINTWQRENFDHLINNAGHGEMAAFADTTEAQFDQLFNVHVKGVFFLTQALLPGACRRRTHRELLLGTDARVLSGLFRLIPPQRARSRFSTVYMAKELGSRGISVNTVAPGAIETDFLGGAVRDMPDLNKHFGHDDRARSRGRAR